MAFIRASTKHGGFEKEADFTPLLANLTLALPHLLLLKYLLDCIHVSYSQKNGPENWIPGFLPLY